MEAKCRHDMKLQLKRIRNGDGAWIDSQDLMAKVAVEFFQKQFKQEADPINFELLNNVPAMVSTEQNLELCRFPSTEVVKGAVFALSGESASGPDGFSGILFQECWDIVGDDIYNILQVISRVVHDSLEKILPSLISSNQLGFVKGTSIFENILLTLEIVTDIRLRGKPANVVIKLDMAKAYDKVS
ncbi:uncharacterized protein LOC142163885 [Nicotiana tabacum]|uniref:Uncharacterized protein LOC142163885 n=1 Tax=Nicotiana tabacum TaxID=4097 RepID=A0AC58RWT0_TOBAC